jgi:hypothetical protein
MGITILFGTTGKGKTTLMTHFGNLDMYDYLRTERMLDFGLELTKNNGVKLNLPNNCVYANYTINGFKFRHEEFKSTYINPYRVGFANSRIKTEFMPTHAVLLITEGQKYFNSRMSKEFPDWASRWYEAHRHNENEVYIDVQRPGLIDQNIRDLARFIEIREKRNIMRGKRIVGIEWDVRICEDSSALDLYLKSGKQDKSCYTEETIVADYNVHDCFNSHMYRPKYYQKFIDDNFKGIALDEDKEWDKDTIERYIMFLKEHDDEYPVGFYKSDRAVAA